MEETCIHGMVKAWCALCIAKEEMRGMKKKHRAKEETREMRIRRRRKTANIAPEASRGWHILGHEVIHTNALRQGKKTKFPDLPPQTVFVHLDGHPFVWVIRRLLENYPKLCTIQVTPYKFDRIHEITHKLCRSREVVIKAGYWMPQQAWQGIENRSPKYRAKRKCLLSLEGEAKKRFDELRLYNIFAQRLAARYFCLNGEDYKPFRLLMQEYGFSASSTAWNFSYLVTGLFCYLDPEKKASKTARMRAATIEKKVENYREIMENMIDAATREDLIRELSEQPIPQGLPPKYLDTYEALLIAGKDGRLDHLRMYYNHGKQHSYNAIIRRFGMRGMGKYRTLTEVGDLMGITNEMARMHIKNGLKHMCIKEGWKETD